LAGFDTVALAAVVFAVLAFAVAALAVVALAGFDTVALAAVVFALAVVAAVVVLAAGLRLRGWEVVVRAFPERGAGTSAEAFFSAGSAIDVAVVRGFPWAGAGIRRAPVVGSDPSARRRSWWSELIHLTSVGGHYTAHSRGEERCPCKHVVMSSLSEQGVIDVQLCGPGHQASSLLFSAQ
jgi:hypothetical protein